MFNHNRHTLVRWFTLSMGSILVVFAAGLYYLEVHRELRDIDKMLYGSTKLLAASVRYQEQQGRWQVQLRNVPLLGTRRILLQSSGVLYARWYGTDRRLQQFVGAVPPTLLVNPPRYPLIVTLAGRNPSVDPWVRQLTLPVYAEEHVISYLQVAMSLTATRTTLNEFRLVLSISVPLAIALIAVASWVLSGIAMQPAQQSYQQMEQFTADAAHELRAPVAAILSNAQLGLMPDEGNLPAQRFQNIVELAQYMSSLVSHLLILARSQTLEPETLQRVDLGWLVEEVLDDHQKMIATRSLDLSSQIPDEPIYVNANPELLKQAIANLLTNACKYTPHGGRIETRLRVSAQTAVIEIQDTGIGIPPADLPHIFKRFYRVDKERSRDTGGVGLGLAIAQQIAHSHGGQINVISLLGHGSLFQMTLPIQKS